APRRRGPPGPRRHRLHMGARHAPVSAADEVAGGILRRLAVPPRAIGKVDRSMSKNVLVTGASTGIGRACAVALDRRGFHVFAGVRKEADGEALKKDAPGVDPVIVDVTDQATIDAAAKQIDELYGLVNNAGITVAGPVEYLPIDDIRRQFEVNVFGQIAVTQAFLPKIRESRG